MRIVTIVGARPQFIKAAMISRAIASRRAEGYDIEERILHTGQHYDACMSDIFFKDLSIPPPAWQLNCAEQTHGRMTGRMLIDIEAILTEERPDRIIVYGDTNSTLAGALAAVKLHIPIVHVEAGLRSFNREMPEEINRILVDRISAILCCPTSEAVHNLAGEGIVEGVHHTGDVMYDAAILFGQMADTSSDILPRLGLVKKSFRLCTVHRAENTDSPERLSSILTALSDISSAECPVVFPLHPRTEARIEQYGLKSALSGINCAHIIPPAGFLDMVMLEKYALAILTDSGGIQKEACFHRTPCVTLREETEWRETVAAGWNTIAGCDPHRIVAALAASPQRMDVEEYGTGRAAIAIVNLLQ